MKIKNFANKYGVSKREVDYWTSLGLINPKVSENGYRDYTEENEKEIKYILIAKAAGYKIREDNIRMIRVLLSAPIGYDLAAKPIKEHKQKATEPYDNALRYIKELGGTI